jgi:hypothetical protein
MAKATKNTMTALEIFSQIEKSKNVKLSCIGFIRKSDDEDVIEMSCGDGWEKIPTLIIDDISYIETDHLGVDEYPLVKIYFKEAETEEGKAFAAVARFSKVRCEKQKPIASRRSLLEEAGVPQLLSSAVGLASPLVVAAAGRLRYKWDDIQKCWVDPNDTRTPKECLFYAFGDPRAH